MSRISVLRSTVAATVVGGLLAAGLAGFGQTTTTRSVRVQWGDTLWGLSQRYHVPIAQLASANRMQVADVLLAGRKIYLPAHPSAPAPGASTAPGSAGAASSAQAQHSFCATYKPPSGPRGRLPAGLAGTSRLSTLRPLFSKWAKTFGVPADLMEGDAWQESGWSNTAVSPDGAVGIGQLLPSTAAFVNQSLHAKLSLTVPSDNIEMMAAFLSYLLRGTGGNVCETVAAYYQGLGTLQRSGVLPISQIYVRNVLSLRPRFA